MLNQHTFTELHAGAETLRRGVFVFYSSPRLWKYALIPMGLLLLGYAAALTLAICLAGPLANLLLPEPAGAGEWLRILYMIIRGIIHLGLIALVLLVGALLFSTLYEAIGSFFFDELVARYLENRRGGLPPPLSFRESLLAFRTAMLFALGSMIRSVLALIPALLIPVIGILPAVWLVGPRLGLSCLLPAAQLDRVSAAGLKRFAKKHRALLLGFGGLVCLLQLVPFAGVLLLPGFTLGGAMLYEERVRPELLPSAEQAAPAP